MNKSYPAVYGFVLQLEFLPLGTRAVGKNVDERLLVCA